MEDIKKLVQNMKECLWCRDMLERIWSEIDPGALSHPTWKELNDFFIKKRNSKVIK